MKKTCIALGSATALVLTLAGCGTQVRSLPIQPAAANRTAESNVAIYFGQEPHAAIERRVGEASQSVRIARLSDGAEATCDKALADALGALRADAQRKGANAVINVKTRFHSTETDSAAEYTCGVSPSAAAIAVRGDLVVLQAN